MINLVRPDFQNLTRFLQNLPDFATVRDWRRLVAGAREMAVLIPGAIIYRKKHDCASSQDVLN